MKSAQILYIDDDAAARLLVESLLTKHGHRVTLATNGAEGLELTHLRGFDLVITDAVMPGGVSGFDVTTRIRESYAADKLPIILLTGQREREDVVRAIAAGVNDYVVKPIDPPSFLAKVDQALRARRLSSGS